MILRILVRYGEDVKCGLWSLFGRRHYLFPRSSDQPVMILQSAKNGSGDNYMEPLPGGITHYIEGEIFMKTLITIVISLVFALCGIVLAEGVLSKAEDIRQAVSEIQQISAVQLLSSDAAAEVDTSVVSTVTVSWSPVTIL